MCSRWTWIYIQHPSVVCLFWHPICAMCNSRAYLRCRRPLYISMMGSSTEKIVRKHVWVLGTLLCACWWKQRGISTRVWQTHNLLAPYLGTAVLTYLTTVELVFWEQRTVSCCLVLSQEPKESQLVRALLWCWGSHWRQCWQGKFPGQWEVLGLESSEQHCWLQKCPCSP